MEQTHNTNHGNRVKKRRKQSRTSKHNNPNPDLISDLPDSLLLHILSFLNMKDVMNTTLLSRRWRYLWRSIPCLCFESFMGLNFIDRCLFHHQGSKIHKLRINFGYKDTHSPLVDSWLYFATKCEVENFELELTPCYKLYSLPRSFYLCTTLTSLNLCCCHLNLPDSFQLASLKKLTLTVIELYPDSIERLSSSCPLLEEIYLIECISDRDLINIVITNEHVKKLVISDYGDYRSETLKINAPALLSLGIYGCCSRVRFHVEELGSLMSVDIIGDSEDFYCFVDDVRYVEKLLYDFRHVKHLKLCTLCLQLLSLKKLKSSEIFPISATSLVLNASLEKWEIPGISYLLECCSNLQKLKIVNDNCRGGVRQLSDEIIDEYDFEEEEEYWESFEIDVPSIMQNIKTIEIDLGGKSCHEEFVRFLLKNAKVLERMVIDTPKKNANNFELLFKLSQRLNAFPRSSPNAKLFIT